MLSIGDGKTTKTEQKEVRKRITPRVNVLAVVV
jgi:hypothetical protein